MVTLAKRTDWSDSLGLDMESLQNSLANITESLKNAHNSSEDGTLL